MTDEPKAIKKERPESTFIKNSEKRIKEKEKAVKKDNSITIWDSKKGYNRNLGHRGRNLNRDYLNRCVKTNKNYKRQDFIMGCGAVLLYLSFFVLAYLVRGG